MARKPLVGTVAANVLAHGTGAINVDATRIGKGGRWPANVLLDDEAAAMLDAQAGTRGGGFGVRGGQRPDGYGMGGHGEVVGYGDSGGPSRFYYVAKASRSEREAGLEAIEKANGNKWTDDDYRVRRGERPPSAQSGPRRNDHPTVKPIALMRWLVRLVTPPGGVVLDPFAGSGTTLVAATIEGFESIGMELDAHYCDIAEARVKHWGER
jgi:hypothetical protein